MLIFARGEEEEQSWFTTDDNDHAFTHAKVTPISSIQK